MSSASARNDTTQVVRGRELRNARSAAQPGAGDQFQTLLGQNAPGYEATKIEDLSVHPLLKGKKIDKVGMDALLAQWDQETVRVQDQAEAVFDMTMLRLKELYQDGIIDLQELERRQGLAVSKFNEACNTLQPIQINAKKVFDRTTLEVALRPFSA
jgi:hypothetical protein